MKEHVVSFRVDKDVFAYLQRWSANSGKTVTDILLELLENSRNTRVVNVNVSNVGSVASGTAAMQTLIYENAKNPNYYG